MQSLFPFTRGEAFLVYFGVNLYTKGGPRNANIVGHIPETPPFRKRDTCLDNRKNIEMKIQITDAIVDLLTDQGLKNVTVKEICKKAGISLGTFYTYFSSKYDIVTHMYEVMDDYLLERKDDFMGHATGEEDILSFASAFGQFVQDWGYHANVLILTTSIEEINEPSVRFRKIENLLIEIIEGAIEKKNFACPLETADYMLSIMALIRGTLLEWAKAGKDYPIRKKIEERMRIYLQMSEPRA